MACRGRVQTGRISRRTDGLSTGSLPSLRRRLPSPPARARRQCRFRPTSSGSSTRRDVVRRPLRDRRLRLVIDAMMPVSLRPELPDALRRLRDDLAALRLQLELPDSGRARAARDDIVGQTDDYLLPRLDQMDAPVLDGRRRVDRRREVHDSQQPRRRGGQPVGRAAAHDARARFSSATPTTCAGSRATGSCPACRE